MSSSSSSSALRTYAALTTIASLALASATLFLVLENRKIRNSKPKETIAVRKAFRLESNEEQKLYEDGLLKEQLSRTEQFLGGDGLLKLRNARVTVIGLGGVGSHCAHLLARSGIGQLRFVDFDRVTLSSLNRHALATRSDVGSEKSHVLADRLREIVGSSVVLEPISALCSAGNVNELITGSHMVIDCIDDQATKIDLLEACKRLAIPVISSLGAGGKVDPTRLRIGCLSDSTYDPLAARLRARIQHDKRDVDFEQVEVVYSAEIPKATLLELNKEQTESPQDFGAMPHFRLRIMPVLGTSPALFGMALAARVITRLAEAREFTPVAVDLVSRNMVHSCVQRLRNHEVKVFGRGPDRFTEEDAQFIAVMQKKRCIFTGAKMGAADGKMEMGRWFPDKPMDVDNCVMAQKHVMEAIYKHHAQQTGRPPRGEDIGVSQEIVDNVEKWLRTEKTLEYGL